MYKFYKAINFTTELYTLLNIINLTSLNLYLINNYILITTVQSNSHYFTNISMKYNRNTSIFLKILLVLLYKYYILLV